MDSRDQTHQLKEANLKSVTFHVTGRGYRETELGYVCTKSWESVSALRTQETGSSPNSVPIHVTLGSHSVFSSIKWVHAKIISKFPLVLILDDALIVR